MAVPAKKIRYQVGMQPVKVIVLKGNVQQRAIRLTAESPLRREMTFELSVSYYKVFALLAKGGPATKQHRELYYQSLHATTLGEYRLYTRSAGQRTPSYALPLSSLRLWHDYAKRSDFILLTQRLNETVFLAHTN
jgi:hypothetical protein